MNLTTDDADGKIRLDQYLAAHLPELSRSRIQSLIKSGDVLVNGSPAKPKNPVSRGDSITVRIPEPEPAEAQPQDIPLDILYEDEDVVVINKESGMVVHPAAGNPDGTIVNALLHHCGDLSGIGGVERPGIVHRLDKDTSGCLVIAKNDGAHQSLTAQFAARSTEKRYLAVVQGIPSQSSGTVFTHIGRHPVNRLKMAVVNPGSGKAAITDYDLLCADPSTDSSLVLCTLHTGRTHQIRVHMLHLGHPLIGDPIYAKPARQKAKPGRLMLHAWRLGFDHPRTGKRMDFEAPVPPEYTPWLQLFPNGLYGAIPGAAPGTGRRGTELNLPAISRQRKPLQRTEYGKAPYSNPRAGPAFVSNPPSSGAPILADKDAATDPPFTFLRPLSGRSVHGHSQPGTIFFSLIKEK